MPDARPVQRSQGVRRGPHAVDPRLLRATVPTEHEEQVRLFAWAALASGRFPELAWLYAVPNGGHRHKAVAGKLKAEGVRRGYPDVGLDCARRMYYGLRIELKRQDATPSDTSPEQRAWHEWLRGQGYFVAVCHGWESARATLEWYLRP